MKKLTTVVKNLFFENDELFIEATINGEEHNKPIGAVVDMGSDETGQDLRFFDRFGYQNYFHCVYTSSAKKETSCFKLLPKDTEEIKNTILENKEKFLKAYVSNYAASRKYWAKVTLRKESWRELYLYKNRFGKYEQSSVPHTAGIDKLLSANPIINARLFTTASEIILYKIGTAEAAVTLTTPEQIAEELLPYETAIVFQ